jgi:hypothetical protein
MPDEPKPEDSFDATQWHESDGIPCVRPVPPGARC